MCLFILFRFLCTFVFRCLWNSSQINKRIYLNSDFVLNTKVFSNSWTRLHLWIHHSMLEVIKNYNWLRNRQCINKTESNKGLGIMKLSPKDMLMHSEKKSTTVDIRRQTPTTKTCPCTVTQWRTYRMWLVLHFYVLWPPRHEIATTVSFGLSGHFHRFPPHCTTRPPPFAFCAVPLEAKGVK